MGGWVGGYARAYLCVYMCVCMCLRLNDYFDYIKHHGVFFTIVMLMLIFHNHDSYFSIKDP